ncbi:hypothetical protein HOO54_17235 [Bacillus sp. WMMC1349]|nr:hypothetical protein [Bacillus sp. WMMC1349]
MQQAEVQADGTVIGKGTNFSNKFEEAYKTSKAKIGESLQQAQKDLEQAKAGVAAGAGKRGASLGSKGSAIDDAKGINRAPKAEPNGSVRKVEKGSDAAKNAGKANEPHGGKSVGEGAEGVGEAIEPTIAKKINKALRSQKPDLKLEGEVANSIRGHVIAFRKNIDTPNGRIGEIDVETEKYIIDAFNGKKSKEPSTFTKYFDERAQYINPEGKEVILYAPNISATKIPGIEATGVKVIQSLDELKKLVGGK